MFPPSMRVVSYRSALCLAIVLLFAGFAASASIEDSVKRYLNPGESASYQVITSGNATYYVVSISGNISMVFDGELEIVSDQEKIKGTLFDYFAALNSAGFTVNSASAIQRDFDNAYQQWANCNSTFYWHIERNYFYAQFKCIDPSVGAVCKSAFNQRKQIDKEFGELKAAVESVVSGTSSGDRASVISGLSSTQDLSKSIKSDVTDFDANYKYFFGKSMADEANCLFNQALVSSLVTASAPSVTASVLDITGIAAQVKANTDYRVGLSTVIDVKLKGLSLYDKAKAHRDEVTRDFAANGFPVEGVDAKLEALRSLNAQLTQAAKLDQANTLYAQMETAYAEFEVGGSAQAGLMTSYKSASDAVYNVSKALEFIKRKYGTKDERVESINRDYIAIKQSLDFKNNDLKNGNEVTKESLDAIARNASSLADRAAKLPSKENELDPLVLGVLALLVLLVGGVAVYFLKFKKKPPAAEGEADAPKNAPGLDDKGGDHEQHTYIH